MICFLRHKLNTNNELSSILEYPLLKLVAMDTQSFILSQEVVNFYDGLNLFILDANDIGLSNQKIFKETEHHNKISAELFQNCMPNNILISLGNLQRTAQGRKVFIGIITDEPELDIVPWELLGNSETSHLFNLKPTIAIFRFIERSSDEPEKEDNFNEQAKSKIMLVSSSPLTRQSPTPDQEFQAIENQLKNKVDVYPCKGIEYVDFTRKLLEISPEVLHMAMHGTSNGLVFQKYNTHLEVSYDDLVEDICRVPSLRSVVLDICYSSSISSSTGTSSFAKRLVEAGIPSVIGMASTITLPASLEFSNRLYSELSQGKPILEAYDRAIITLRQQSDLSKLLWSVPVMYQYANVYPFPSIKEHKRILNKPSQLPIKKLIEANERIEGFVINYDAFFPDSTWTTDEWQTETIPIWIIIPALRESIENLGNLPHSFKRNEMAWIFQMNDLRERSLNLLADFEEILAKVTYPEHRNRSKPEFISQLSIIGRKLITSLKDLTFLISKVVGSKYS